jgi:hypothetical protein
MTPDQIERLWDAFEAVDKAAGSLAYGSGSYVPVQAKRALRRALDHYRAIRDVIDIERRMPHATETKE